MDVGRDLEADSLCWLWYLRGHFFCHDEGFWMQFESARSDSEILLLEELVVMQPSVTTMLAGLLVAGQKWQ